VLGESPSIRKRCRFIFNVAIQHNAYFCPCFAQMKKVTLRFPTLQLLADCMFELSILNPVIDYERCLLTADLTDQQVAYAKECQAVIVDIIVAE
jgi:hypothetical protein